VVSVAAVDLAALLAGSFDQDSMHGGRGRREKMSASIPALRLAVADQPQVSLVDERRGLQCLPGLLASQFVCGQLA
jgi:hypothetical protein